MVTLMSTVDPRNSSHVGHVHFFSSSRVSCTYVANRRICPCHQRQAKADPIATTRIAIVQLLTNHSLKTCSGLPSRRSQLFLSASRLSRPPSFHSGAAAIALASLPAKAGGEGGIRTPVGLSPKAVFKTAAIDHSATSPRSDKCHVTSDKTRRYLLPRVTRHFHHCWHGRRDLNPQPTVLETATLPVELLPYRPNLVRFQTKKRPRGSSPAFPTGTRLRQ